MGCNLNLGFNFPHPQELTFNWASSLSIAATSSSPKALKDIGKSLASWRPAWRVEQDQALLWSLSDIFWAQRLWERIASWFLFPVLRSNWFWPTIKNMQTGVRQFPGFSRGFPGSFFRPFWTLLHNGKLIGSNLQILQWFGVSYMFSLLVPQILCLEFGNLSADLRHQDMRTNWI